ncbi:MAG: DUF2147 domain-containing protein [Bacteroidetes bacterium]|nr:DUF2147 domain-containing protein [Bacteroidota bacterium]
MLTKKFLFVSVIILTLLFGFTSDNSSREANRILGIWQTEEKNLQIEMIEGDGYYAGRMIWFLCASGESMMFSYRDTENPNPKFTTRPLIGMNVVEKIYYKGDNVWGDGKIYDPNSGHTYDARITLTAPNTAIVRGYWKFRWIGKSIVFHRL